MERKFFMILVDFAIFLVYSDIDKSRKGRVLSVITLIKNLAKTKIVSDVSRICGKIQALIGSLSTWSVDGSNTVKSERNYQQKAEMSGVVEKAKDFISRPNRREAAHRAM